ncbi:19239_t:CDS:2 [Funneliformis geosporum]|uniref:thymidine kinase n=1 Tax=Funneliformis geosporum TaxID=1117311 RepID=A0A9W4WTP0_9GLOM|nr:19239_t:CDS:2 [Funneliformis geosporum]CAI2171372.1 13813_t:CDS:2 [Funneliformis geosporum]
MNISDIINDHIDAETSYVSNFLRNVKDIETFPTGNDLDTDDKNKNEAKMDHFTLTRTSVPIEYPATSPFNALNDTQYLGGDSPIQKCSFFGSIPAREYDRKCQASQESRCKYRQHAITCSGKADFIRVKLMSKLTIITGPMFAGKTEELLRRIHRCQIAKNKYLLFKPSLDNRYSTAEVVSHQKNKAQAIVLESSNEIDKYISQEKEQTILFFDELQFFDEGIGEKINFLLKKGFLVIGAGLDKNFRGEPFNEVMKSLLSLADEVIKLKAICQVCQGEASFTQRVISGQPAAYDSPLVLIAGQDGYEARCRQCYACPRS